MTTIPPVVWSEDVLRHEPGAEIWVGVATPGTEVPDRARVLRDAVLAAGGELIAAASYDDAVLRRVHDPALVDHLAHIHDDWAAGPYEELVGQDRVVPYVFPTAGMLDGLPMREPTAAHARAGLYCYDTMTLVGAGTWVAARSAVDVALTAADLVVDGPPAAYALVRPPGHHATRAAFGGSCYLNNAAVAAQRLRDRGVDRVAVVDIDAHHGNGTQSIFYERADVFYGSLHVDPGAGWFPHFVGFAHERGRGDGAGTTYNRPLAPGTGDAGWLAALDEVLACVSAFAPGAVVVSLGVDAAGGDPESPLEVSTEGFHGAGERLSALGRPTVLVHEGGYDLARLGVDAVAVLAAFGDDTSRAG
ncbi:MAG: histone deacetylase family protein [Actinomycetes bacterium]